MNPDNDIKDKIFDFVYTFAMRDATMQKAYYEEGKQVDKKKLLKCDDAKKEVIKYIDGIFDNEYIGFYETANKVVDAFGKFLKNDNPTFSFGNAQKLINMCAKYYYVSIRGNETLKKNFSVCHCPMDKIIVDIVIKKLDAYEKKNGSDDRIKGFKKKHTVNGDKEITWKSYLKQPWSKADKKQYELFQDIVLYLCEKERLTPLEFDYKYWDSNKD